MTLAEIQDAIDGDSEVRAEKFKENLLCARLISYYAAAPHVDKKAGIRKPSDLFELPGEREQKTSDLKRRIISGQLKPIEVIRGTNAEQPNS